MLLVTVPEGCGIYLSTNINQPAVINHPDHEANVELIQYLLRGRFNDQILQTAALNDLFNLSVW